MPRHDLVQRRQARIIVSKQKDGPWDCILWWRSCGGYRSSSCRSTCRRNFPARLCCLCCLHRCHGCCELTAVCSKGERGGLTQPLALRQRRVRAAQHRHSCVAQRQGHGSQARQQHCRDSRAHFQRRICNSLRNRHESEGRQAAPVCGCRHWIGDCAQPRDGRCCTQSSSSR